MQLHKIHLRVLGQNGIQHIGGIVEGKTHLLHLALAFHLGHKFKGAQFFRNVVVFGIQAVKQIIVKVIHPALLLLLLKDPRQIFLLFQKHGGHFIRHGEAVPWVPLHHGPAQNLFALIFHVHIGGIKISKALFQKPVNHGAHRFKLNFSR